jgi:hypothetical protein
MLTAARKTPLNRLVMNAALTEHGEYANKSQGPTHMHRHTIQPSEQANDQTINQSVTTQHPTNGEESNDTLPTTNAQLWSGLPLNGKLSATQENKTTTTQQRVLHLRFLVPRNAACHDDSARMIPFSVMVRLEEQRRSRATPKDKKFMILKINTTTGKEDEHKRHEGEIQQVNGKKQSRLTIALPRHKKPEQQ